MIKTKQFKTVQFIKANFKFSGCNFGIETTEEQEHICPTLERNRVRLSHTREKHEHDCPTLERNTSFGVAH